MFSGVALNHQLILRYPDSGLEDVDLSGVQKLRPHLLLEMNGRIPT
jgi:hypothetical protein